MKTKIILPLFVFCAILMSCNKEIIKTPDNLIEQDKMVDIMYDLSLLSAMKIQYSSMPDTEAINSNEYIYKKYKIDSLQFVQSNIYYASDTKEYQKMILEIKTRLDKNKSTADSIFKIKEKKDLLVKKKQEKLKQIRLKDSISKIKKEIKTASDSIKKYKFIDSHWPLYIDEYLKTPYLKRF
ncbi:DUF4296 domain-containing protein [Flavobacterium cellulosilyticum]|uniref:DUF4296 domain-containing protein n=1 Tax=Flavobacterium cellulosilyticum TaxID=2541731 RepID=A0A4R5CJF3_9FLAO|nr:DUF4296 domain-containing protein [Flavobacterium cellulosilyticum]TDD99276.1 DUF4296 domain-containing protein [Flavobacterium cellulosilyticum]